MFSSFWYSLKNMFNFSGRSRRGEYVYFCVVLLLYWLASILVLGKAMAVLSMASSFGGILIMVWHIALLVAYLALVVRRLHDFGQSGWWVLLLLVSLPLSFLPVVGAYMDHEFWFRAVWISFWVLFFFFAGQQGPNKYGPDPLAALSSSGPGEKA
jgi:uncharacterized membrane protein YhaH (DUF805 family)